MLTERHYREYGGFFSAEANDGSGVGFPGTALFASFAIGVYAVRENVERVFVDGEAAFLGDFLLPAFDFLVVELFDTSARRSRCSLLTSSPSSGWTAYGCAG